MKRACILGAVALVIGWAAIPSLGYADSWEGWRGSGGWGVDSPYNRSYDPTKKETAFSYCETRRGSQPGLVGVEGCDPRGRLQWAGQRGWGQGQSAWTGDRKEAGASLGTSRDSLSSSVFAGEAPHPDAAGKSVFSHNKEGPQWRSTARWNRF